MVRARQAQGRPNTAVMPAGWQAGHAPVIARALTSTVVIGPEGGVGVWSEGAGQTLIAGAAPVYTGAASLMPVSDTARILTVVEDPTSTRVYDVTLDLTDSGADAIKTDHVITVTASNDANLVDKTLRISGIERGTQRFSRVLLAVLND